MADNEYVVDHIDIQSPDGRTRYRIKVTNRLVAVRLEKDAIGEWKEPPNGHGLFPIAGH
jgi:hypothetical protein